MNYRVNAFWNDGSKRVEEFDTELQANRCAARLSRAARRGGPECFAVVYCGGNVVASWRDGKKVKAKPG